MFSKVGKNFGHEMLVNLSNDSSPNAVLIYVLYLGHLKKNSVDSYGKNNNVLVIFLLSNIRI